ncbi:hypothetical protein EBU99_00835 [bacterium]|nr:hypothetical protein [bacterium]
MSQNPQLHLTNDSFLYACQSEFAARSKKDGSFNSHLRFEEFLLGTFKRPHQATMRDFSQLVSAITTHHFQITPQFRRHESLNLETVAYFTSAIATLFADLETACKEFFGLGLPVIPENPPEYSAEGPLTTAVLSARGLFLVQAQASTDAVEPFEAFPRPEFPTMTAEEQMTVWSCEVWDSVAEAIHAAFAEYADMAMGFAYWKYQETPSKGEIDWRVRPPVGEAYAKAFKPMLRNARGDRGGSDRGGRESRGPGADRGGREGRGPGADRGGREGRGPGAERGGREGRGPGAERGGREGHTSNESFAEKSGASHDRPRHSPERSHSEQHVETRASGVDRRNLSSSDEQSRERNPRQRHSEKRPEGHEGRGERSERHPRRDNDSRNRPSGGPTSELQLTEALEEVRQAALALKANPGLGEIALKPSNSFIRRQQHSLAVEMGLDTESRGEGRDRGVVIRPVAL